MACDMPEPCKFPSLDSCQKRFLGTHKEVDLSPHPVVGLVIQEGDAVEFLRHLASKALILFLIYLFMIIFLVSNHGPCFTAVEEDGGDTRLVEVELLAKLIMLHRQILFSLAIAIIAVAILMRTAVEQMQSSQRVSANADRSCQYLQ